MMDHSWTLFMDRDGVVNRQIIGGYVQNPEQFVLLDGFVEAMQLLKTKFCHIIMVTNQQGIEKGICTKAGVEEVHENLQNKLRAVNAPFDAIYYCPHLATKHCACRKPEIGMALQAQQDFPDIDFAKSIMVGDSLSDMQFAQHAGMTAIHVGSTQKPDFVEIMKIAQNHFENLYDFSKNC